jgi:uncharacterized protein YgiM (DUF1202 family)
LSCQSYCQTKLEVLSHNNTSVIVIDSTTAVKLLMKLEDGEQAMRELEVCDSISVVNDSIIEVQQEVISNMGKDAVKLSSQIRIQKEQLEISKIKFDVCDKERKKHKRNKFIYGASGLVVGILLTLSL